MALVHEARLLLSCRGAFGQVINDIVQLSGARERLNAVMITNIIGSKGARPVVGFEGVSNAIQRCS